VRSFLKQGIPCVQGGHASIYGEVESHIRFHFLFQGMHQDYSGSFIKIYELEHHIRPTQLEWVDGGLMNLKNLG
jgi:hypothetical protein